MLLSMYQLWTSGSSDKNKGMVEQLERYGIVQSKRVKEVMEAIDRGLFVPAGSGSPYYDSPMRIGYNATISAPHMHATCLELLEKHLQPGMRALDVGSGCVFVYNNTIVVAKMPYVLSNSLACAYIIWYGSFLCLLLCYFL